MFMNPLRWSRELQVGCAVVCVLGAVFGLFVGFIIFSVIARISYGAGMVFKFWIQRPDLYWPWPTFGAVIAGLAFYAVWILRHRPTISVPESAETPGEKSRADVYYPIIAKAVSQLPINDRDARQTAYGTAQMALAAQFTGPSSNSELEREQVALETAIRRFEKSVSQGMANNSPAWSQGIANPLYRPTTGELIISILFPGLWAQNSTSMSLYWVARLPRV